MSLIIGKTCSCPMLVCEQAGSESTLVANPKDRFSRDEAHMLWVPFRIASPSSLIWVYIICSGHYVTHW